MQWHKYFQENRGGKTAPLFKSEREYTPSFITPEFSL